MHRVLIAFLFLVLLSSCNQVQESKFQLPSENDVQAIIQTVILEDSIPVLSGKQNQYPLLSELTKLKAYPSNQVILVVEGIHKDYLLKKSHDNAPSKLLFAEKDSIYFEFLNNWWLNRLHIIDNKAYNIIQPDSLVRIDKKGKHPIEKVYAFSIPIFSEDNSTAYIELACHCGERCRHDKTYGLKKISQRWKIVNRGWKTFG
jgi:hypothetical protein